MDEAQGERRVIRRRTTPKHPKNRTRYIARWFTGSGIPNLREDGYNVVGMSGVTITVGGLRGRNGHMLARMRELSWDRRKVIHIVPSEPGESIQDSVALVRIDFLAELLVPYVEENKDRLFGRE